MKFPEWSQWTDSNPTEFYDAAEFLPRFPSGEETVLSQLSNMAGKEMQRANYHGFYINTD